MWILWTLAGIEARRRDTLRPVEVVLSARVNTSFGNGSRQAVASNGSQASVGVGAASVDA